MYPRWLRGGSESPPGFVCNIRIPTYSVDSATKYKHLKRKKPIRRHPYELKQFRTVIVSDLPSEMSVQNLQPHLTDNVAKNINNLSRAVFARRGISIIA